MLIAFLVNIILMVVCAFIHYGCLSHLAKRYLQTQGHVHWRLLHGLLVVFMAHIMEVWVFAVAYYFIHDFAGMGLLVGEFSGSLMDCLYYSLTCYTSLGIGDIRPQGWLRITSGLETLVGLVLIAWSASYLYICMEREWLDNDAS